MDCGSGFEFPDSEPLIRAEFEKNIPFAVSVAKSAKDPDDPVSAVGRTAENFRIDSFDVSYGDPQKVAVTVKRAVKLVTMQYRINGGRLRLALAPEWQGGERYGHENDDYYVERRGVVRGAHVGDEVEVWFTGIKTGGGLGIVAQPALHLHRRAQQRRGRARDRQRGLHGRQPQPSPGSGPPKYADEHVAAVQAAGHQADVWDVDAQGVPHDLGVLSHYKAVVWYLGDNRLTQDPEDVLISTPFGQLADIGVAERQQYLTMSVRDFLNEGGKLIHDGETTQYEGLPGISDAVGGLYYGLNGDPAAECHVDSVPGFFEDCLILADDFRQYYLGAFLRTSIARPGGRHGIARAAQRLQRRARRSGRGGRQPARRGRLVPADERRPAAGRSSRSSRARARRSTQVVGVDPFAPVEGSRYAAAVHADDSYMRLQRDDRT